MKLKKYGNTEKIVYDLALPLANQLNLQIWDVCFEKEGAEWYLRVFIDSPNGISIDDCENLSRPLNDKIDEVDPIKQRYFFEVGSAGLGRCLTKEHHFEQSIGNLVEVTFIRPHTTLGKSFIGQLNGFTKDTVNITPENSETNEVIQLVDVSSIKLYEDFEF